MRLPKALIILNGLGALVAAGFSVVALFLPEAALPAGASVTPLATLYAEVYASRAVPLGVLTLVLLARGEGPALVAVLAIAGLAQLGDAVSGALHGVVRMVMGGGLLAALHLGSAYWLGRPVGATAPPAV